MTRATLISRLWSIGFRVEERMTGTHRFEPGFGPEQSQRVELDTRWGAESVGRLFSRDDPAPRQAIDGRITIGGLCYGAPCEGIITLDYFGERRIRYDLKFRAGKRDYRFVGEKVNLRLWNLAYSHTTCFGRITDVAHGRLVSTSVLEFRLRSLPRLLTSLRITRRSTVRRLDELDLARAHVSFGATIRAAEEALLSGLPTNVPYHPRHPYR